MYVPGSTVRSTNQLNFWTVSRANRWGFLDRPPLLDRPQNSSCRVALVGDSFVEASQVAISDKLQVRIEEMATSRMPTLRVAASGYGMWGTGQVAQLGLYDSFVSRSSPDIVVLVFVRNDFVENAYLPNSYFVSATRRGDGTFELLPPQPGAKLPSWLGRASTSSSYAIPMLKALITTSRTWRRARRTLGLQRERDIDLGPEALEHTGFALDQWKARARRDNFFLVILASHTMGKVVFGPMERLASARDIPVIDSNAYLRRRNRRARDGSFRNDHHWNRTGHQWAAEAFLEWLEQNQGACAGHPGPGSSG